MRLRALLTLCCLTLAGAHAMANPYQPVTRLACPGGEFAVDARPWGEKTIDFTPPWPRRSYLDLLKEHAGVDPEDHEALLARAQAAAPRHAASAPPTSSSVRTWWSASPKVASLTVRRLK